MESQPNNLPNFFIVGAVKSGTTSLSEYLNQHPDIYMSPYKEPHFFLPEGEMVSNYYGKLENYTALFKDVKKEKAIGEASTGYLYYPEAAKQINKTIPDSKIIIILRNPVEVAFSLHQHYFRLGIENLGFEEAITKENERMNDPKFKFKVKKFHAGYYYIDRAKFYRQVKFYLDHFGAERVLIVFLDELKNSALETCRKIFGFLGVDSDFQPVIEVRNPAWKPRFRFINRYLLYPNKLVLLLGSIIPSSKLREKIVNIILNKNKKRDEKFIINESTRLSLLEEFKEDIELLEDLLNVNLSHWKT